MTRLLTTREAAALYGCGPTNLTKMAKRYGVPPREIRDIQFDSGWGYSRQMFWHPADVLALRKKIRRANDLRKRATRIKVTPDVAARVKKLQQDKLRAYYRLPRDQRKGLKWLSTPLPASQ